MARKTRSRKMRDVSQSLAHGKGHRSDQGAVWEEIDELNQRAGTKSSTGAMRDAYTHHSRTLDEYLSAFEPEAGQQGSLVFINGQLEGLDLLSLTEAYQTIHPQLIRSYAIEAMLEHSSGACDFDIEQASDLLHKLHSCDTSQFDSVSLGTDVRLKNVELVGAALTYEE